MLFPDIKEPGAKGCAQPLVATGCVEVAAEACDGERDLSWCVGAVDADGYVFFVSTATNFRNWQDDCRGRSDMAHYNQPRAVRRLLEQRIHGFFCGSKRERKPGDLNAGS